MFKLWVNRLVFGVLFFSLAVFPFEKGAQAGPDPALLSVGVQPPALPPGFQLLSITKDSLTLEVQAPSYSFETPQADGLSCQTLQAEGYSQGDTPGKPGLLSAGVMLGIPVDVEPAIRIIAIDTIQLSGRFHLCPVATPQIEYRTNREADYQGELLIEDAQAYSLDAFLPVQAVELVPAGMIRSQRVAQLRFMPFQYNAARGELRLVRRLRLEIRMGGGMDTGLALTPAGEGLFEPLLRQVLINYDQSRQWRARSEVAFLAPSFASAPQDGEVYKIGVDQDGVYQLTYAALQSAGLPVGALDPRTLRLFNQGIEIPLFVSGEGDGSFDPGDYVLFYGQKTATRFTNTNVYWLSWGTGNGARMAVFDGAVVGGAPVPAAYKTMIHLEENHQYFSAQPSGQENDHWYWYFLNAYSAPASRNFTFQLTNLAAGSHTARVRGLLKGSYAAPQHHTRVWLNGHLLDDATWPSTGERLFAVDVPQAYLVEGTNTITVECPRDGGITVDQTLVNWFELDYYHAYTAENDLLVFGGDQPGRQEFRVGGFSNGNISVFDITNPLAPARIVGGSIIPDGSFYQVSFEQPASGAARYLALSPSRWLTPAAITPDAPSNLKSAANGADYIVVSHADFMSAIQPLATYRAGQGLRVKAVDVQDVYDEFNGGVFDPGAIQSFLAYAYSHWAPPAPSYVLLVGDGHYDFKDYYGGSGPNYIPPFLGEFDPWIGETASDNRYVTISGSDTLPDMYIGRLTANSAAEAAAMVDKIIAYETEPLQGDWNTRLTFVADNADAGGNFPASSDAIADHALRPEFSAEKIYYGVTHATISETRAAILAAVNQGRLIVHYNGHGSTQFWASEQLLHVNNIASLTNSGRYPLFLPMTCAEGYFIFPKAQGFNYPSLAESLVRANGKGAIASFSPTGFGLSNGHDVLAQGLYQAIFSNGTLQLGPATTFAKYYLNANSSGFRDLLDTYLLFGDPATRLKISPTAVLLTSFTGQALAGVTRLDWETANEVGVTGFNIYRAATLDGARQQLNASLIPTRHFGQMQGDDYAYFDPVGPGQRYFYWLELVQVGGSDLYGPVEVASGYWINLPLVRK